MSHEGPCTAPCPGMEQLGHFQAFGVRATNFGQYQHHHHCNNHHYHHYHQVSVSTTSSSVLGCCGTLGWTSAKPSPAARPDSILASGDSPALLPQCSGIPASKILPQCSVLKYPIPQYTLHNTLHWIYGVIVIIYCISCTVCIIYASSPKHISSIQTYNWVGSTELILHILDSAVEMYKQRAGTILAQRELAASSCIILFRLNILSS